MGSTPATSPSAPSVPTATKRFSEVDGLRAVACAMVVVSHVSSSFAGIAEGGDWLGIWSMGRLGVLIFFAISGFVIPSSLRGLRWEGVKRFAVRRFWRLYPPYWVALLLTCFFWGSSHYPLERLPWDSLMLPHLRKYAGLEHAHGFGHFWTLEVELFFYLAVALLFLVFASLRWKVLLTAYIALGLGIVFGDFYLVTPNSFTLPALMMMFWGALCREVLRFDSLRYIRLAPRWGLDYSRALVLGGITAPLVWLGIWCFFYVSDSWWNIEVRFGLSILCAVFGFLLWVVLKPMRINWLSHVGRWTYSAYLFHGLVIHAAVNGFILLIPYLSWLSGWPLPVYAIVTLVLSFAVGAVAYRWIEQPSDAIGKRLAAR